MNKNEMYKERTLMLPITVKWLYDGDLLWAVEMFDLCFRNIVKSSILAKLIFFKQYDSLSR